MSEIKYKVISIDKLGICKDFDNLENATYIAQDACIKEHKTQYIVKVIAQVAPQTNTIMTTFD